LRLCLVYFSAPAIQKEKDKPLEELHCLTAHTGNCICLEFDTTGKYFAVGAADASASIWDVAQLVCLTVLTRFVLIAHSVNASFHLIIELNGLYVVLVLVVNHNYSH
jgi:WD40 repeat protein